MNPRTLDSRVSPRPIHPHPHPRPVKMPRSPGGAVAVVPGSVLPAYPDSPEAHFSPGPFLTPLFLASLSVFGAQQHLPAFPTSCLHIRAWARLRVCECVCAVCTCRTCGIKAGSGVWGERQRRNRTPYVWGDQRTQRRELARGPGPGRIPPRHPPREGLSTDNPQAVGRAMRRRIKYLNCGIK